MASSQVEIASSSPFGCVLKDHNRRDQSKNINARPNFQKNLEDLVKDQIQSCISPLTSDSNSRTQVDNGDCSVSKDRSNNDHKQKKSKIQERWAQAREMVCNSPKIKNGDKKAKITREMVCSMLQIDDSAFPVGNEQSSNNEKIQKKPKSRETKQSNKEDKNGNKLKVGEEMVRNKLQTDSADCNVHSEESNDNDKNQNKLKVVQEMVCNQLQVDKNDKNLKKSKIQEQWAHAREKVRNQPQGDNVDCSVSNNKQSNGKNRQRLVQGNCTVQIEESNNNDKDQKTKSKNQERWARAREKVCNLPQRENVDAGVQNHDNDKNHKKLNCSNVKIENEDSPVQEQSKRNEENLKKLKTYERWARAREIVCNNASGVSSPLLGVGVSSLLQKWKGYEAKAKNLRSNTSTNTSPGSSINTNSGSTFIENASYVELSSKSTPSSESSEQTSADEREGARIVNEDAFPDWESDKISLSGPSSCKSRDSDALEEKEKVRVVDLIRKLTSVTKSQQGCSEDIREGEQALSSNESLPRVGTEVLCCPRIRGRQAFNNLLLQIERDRQRELEGLVERKPVSKFPHRGRIQALLKVRFMRTRRLAETGDHAISSSTTSSQLNRPPQGTNIMHLRERFRKGVEHGTTDQKTTCKEVVDNTPDMQKCSVSNREEIENAANIENSYTPYQIKEETHHHGDNESRNSCKNMVDKTQNMENSSTLNQLEEEIHRYNVTDLNRSREDVLHNTQDVENSTTLNQLREKRHRWDITDPENSHRDAVHNTQYVKKCSTKNQLREKSPPPSSQIKESKPCENVDTNVEQNTSKVENQRTLHEESTDIVCQVTSCDVSNIESLESAHAVSSREDEANDGQQLGSTDNHIKDISHAQTIWEDLESCHDWLSDISQLRNEWEQMCNDQQLVETNNDWIADIARPRSDWEDLRQARYQEMLDPYSDNRDIRQLLERRSVSSFLSSDMRDAIDRLMISRTQKQANQMGSPADKQKEVVEEEKDDKLEYKNDNSDNDEEDRLPIEQQYNEFGEYTDRTYPLERHSQSLLSPWSDIQDNEVSDYSNQAASPSLQKYVSSNSSTRDVQQCTSFMNSPSIDMEFIYDLRGHMEQLHQEMFEIRKSLKSCINMQVKLQRSIKQEVASAVKRSVRKEGKESARKTTRKGRCCVCNEKRIDSLLYRCGHMCTCFKCAHDLQMSTGKCPVCEAPILDVVRPYADDR
ncbi:hypothetical protein LguiA_014658 [Lonicera macranthoides]